MSERDFFSQAAKDNVREAVRAVEARCGAELVVVVKRASTDSRLAPFVAGLGFAAAWLGYLFVSPTTFELDLFAEEAWAAFAVGTLVGWLPPVRRALLGAKKRAGCVRRAAKESFYDAGVSKTKARVGLLCYVSTFERDVALVPDVGLVAVDFDEAEARLRIAVRSRSVIAFASAIRALGEPLEACCPRSDDDENELADEVGT